MSHDSDFPVRKRHFTPDTSRPHSRSKRHAQIRHVLAIISAMCPLSALFIFLMSLFRLPIQRAAYYRLCFIFLAAGMLALFFYLIEYARSQRRHRISNINREERHRRQEQALREEREALAARRAENPPPVSPS